MVEISFYFLILSAVGFDLLVGDPTFVLHPVEVMGFYIKKTTNYFVKNFNLQENILFWGGLFIALSTIFVSYSVGKFIEFIFYSSGGNLIIGMTILVGLSSCLASKSLISIVQEIANCINKYPNNKERNLEIVNKVQKIVSRDVTKCSQDDLLRSATESLTENAVDGIFAPLFWMFLGTLLIRYSIYLPGPLSLGFTYKAISTLDSMIGYNYNSFKHLGFFSARIEDFSTFIPCRLVVFTLPLMTKEIRNYFNLIKKVFYDGEKYESPNSGISEAVFAYITNIKLGGTNQYPEGLIEKPILNARGTNISSKSIKDICNLILRLEIGWVLLFSLVFYIT